ncbi:transcriptional regulator [Clostridium sp. SY8519]|jgi:DNA-binding Lrp family transcriptional regulator|nr:transcriptional regulator [Clostridium sp. SY8519]
MSMIREKILSYLEKNSRVGIDELAVILGEDEIIVANEIKAMEEENIIVGFHTLINWDKTNIEQVTGLIEVSCTPQRGQGFDSIAERIYNYPEVKAVYLISGSFDLLITIEGKSLREVAMFVSEKLSPMDSITGTKTNFILKKYKDHGTVMVGRKKDERMLMTP